ncbi:hypothetical protein [Asticcacaulis sp. EMRT-3]|uniref:hypothetical protein n=1 Tax=Asticcacaulis sp. EMRT-3 TaxID=3040349 RepID=UPI0024AEBF77|nr:hypothetical protein [Asticcacaulis sp. EMRT-3]MDI7774981.1 hypothetical protein [Asticcacaulis sp. EMRT-3]
MSDKGRPQGTVGMAQDRASRIAEQKAARLQAALRDNLRRRKLAAQNASEAAVSTAAPSVNAASDAAEDGQG